MGRSHLVGIMQNRAQSPQQPVAPQRRGAALPAPELCVEVGGPAFLIRWNRGPPTSYPEGPRPTRNPNTSSERLSQAWEPNRFCFHQGGFQGRAVAFHRE